MAKDRKRSYSKNTDVIIIDTSTDGWKAVELLPSVIDDKETLGICKPVDPTKVKRKAGLVSAIRRDMENKEMEKEVISSVSYITSIGRCRDGLKTSSGKGVGHHMASKHADVTVIDTSTDGWKAVKLLHAIDNKKTLGICKPVDPTKVKRKAGPVSAIRRDMENKEKKEKEVISSVPYITNIGRCKDGFKIFSGKGVGRHMASKHADIIIDTSTDGWKTVKLPLHAIDDKTTSGICKPAVDPTKVKRKAGPVSSGNIYASSRDGMQELDAPIQSLKRSRCSKPKPESQSA
ncbi:uncharacterized protein LOC102706083 isoform X2 [Oryza brachyantha]|uniref:uncharacterized protein LOC102706083 isoform X2 n=1 Tax=Oryza brachyantha TaxID=4533 RepID=UPI0007763636|nr:uncharacterized protein LOC102706083 isoform X2 [Oryza brachyantha]